MDARPAAGVLCFGNLVLDIVVRPVEQVKWGATTWVESIEQRLGGNGASTSYALATLGVPARLVGMAGNDAFGDFLVEKLRLAGVDVSRVRRSAGATATSAVLVDSSGARALLHRLGVSMEAFSTPADLTPGLTEGCGYLHLANVYSLPHLQRHAAELLRQARLAGLATALDTGWDARGRWFQTLEACLPLLDFLFVNRDEARELTGQEDPRQGARFLLAHGVRHVIVKLGGDGCAVFRSESEIHSPAFEVPVVDTTGAGDRFVAGFLAALAYGGSLEDAARLGNALGALSVQRLGAAEGLLSYPETLRWIERTPVRALKAPAGEAAAPTV